MGKITERTKRARMGSGVKQMNFKIKRWIGIWKLKQIINVKG